MEFTGEKMRGQLVYDDPKGRQKYIDKLKDGRFREILKPVKHKTNPQLGYYWGLLLPEIHKEHLEQGMTTELTTKEGQTFIFPPTTEETHNLLKDLCARIGDDGERMNLLDMDKYQLSKYIDNVLFHATNNLGMNGEKLEAKRPKEK